MKQNKQRKKKYSKWQTRSGVKSSLLRFCVVSFDYKKKKKENYHIITVRKRTGIEIIRNKMHAYVCEIVFTKKEEEAVFQDLTFGNHQMLFFFFQSIAELEFDLLNELETYKNKKKKMHCTLKAQLYTWIKKKKNYYQRKIS